ncbi:phage holin [Mycolicibacterium nivoides]|uniref:Holin n=1 Tax=Mycolicibacterium nivoides TaxID=2487344 RepID=A0ABW9L8C6_9MYCO
MVDQPATPVVQLPGWLGALAAKINPAQREGWYRAVSGLFFMLWAVGVLTQDEAAKWTQFGISSVTLLFALLYATSPWRVAIYGLIVPLSAVLTWYGIATGINWPLVAAAVAQVLGITTAAAKTVQAAA